jgi:hypothetical protein
VAVVLYFLRQQWSVRLCYFDREFVSYSVDDLNLFEVVYERLASVTFASERGVSQLIDAASFGAGDRQDMCVITASIADCANEEDVAAAAGGGTGTGMGTATGTGTGMGIADDSGPMAWDPVLQRLEMASERGSQATLLRIHGGDRPASIRLWREAVYLCDIGCGDDLREVFAGFAREQENAVARRAFSAHA